jgi:hypothetical protein
MQKICVDHYKIYEEKKKLCDVRKNIYLALLTTTLAEQELLITLFAK